MLVILVGVSGALGPAACSRDGNAAATAASRQSPPRQLTNASPSIDALMQQLLDAVAKNDPASLQRLRVTETEYQTIIVPGTVAPGQPPRIIDAETTHFYWTLLDKRSRDFSAIILKDFGGQKLRRTSLEFTKGPQQYGGYTAYGRVDLHVVDEQGNAGLVRSGTIAEVDGQYKLIGLNWND